jgi:hypothetical protein
MSGGVMPISETVQDDACATASRLLMTTGFVVSTRTSNEEHKSDKAR